MATVPTSYEKTTGKKFGVNTFTGNYLVNNRVVFTSEDDEEKKSLDGVVRSLHQIPEFNIDKANNFVGQIPYNNIAYSQMLKTENASSKKSQ